MSITKHTNNLDVIFERVKAILFEARNKAWQAVNSAMVVSYWEIGRIIIEEEQKGKKRADYGSHLLDALSERLTNEFGKGFDRSNVSKMRALYLSYPIIDAVRLQFYCNEH